MYAKILTALFFTLSGPFIDVYGVILRDLRAKISIKKGSSFVTKNFLFGCGLSLPVQFGTLGVVEQRYVDDCLAVIREYNS